MTVAARHTRKRIKAKAAKNRPAGRDGKQTPSGNTPDGNGKPAAHRSTAGRTGADEGRHPCATHVTPHRPQ
jgi:hypothetical protein